MGYIHKPYDIRVASPKKVNIQSASRIGRECAHMFDSGKIVISQDARRGGMELRRAFCEGLIREGGAIGKDFDLVQVDMSTIPLFRSIVSYHRAAGGAMLKLRLAEEGRHRQEDHRSSDDHYDDAPEDVELLPVIGIYEHIV